jgi:arginyl-tRNA synthetase
VSANLNSRSLYGECKALLKEHGALEHCVAIETRRREGHQADIRLVFADRRWLQSPAGDELLAVLEEHPMLEQARRRKSTIHLRFSDQLLVDLERRLGDGESAGMGSEDILAGRHVTVSYVGPNTNKALHVGHLRNVVIGEALASAFAAAGATVRRHNLVGDIGRRMCEAMAGYLSFHDGRSPLDMGLAGDQFVELCSQDYSRKQAGSKSNPEQNDPNAEERTPVGDLADVLMTEWLAGAEAELELWRRMREWTLGGHEDTLARLGIVMDHCDYESDAIPRAVALIEEGIEAGVLEREESGAIIFRTERPDYPTMVLMREDGFPTEHARLLGAYDHILEELHADEPYIEVAGFEWQPAILVLCALHGRLRPGPLTEAHLRVYHASVTYMDGAKIGSSVGDVVWIDDFLAEVAAGAGVDALAELAEGAVERQVLADILVRGTFLCAPPSRPLTFSPASLIEGRSGPGWTIAEAWCRTRRAGEANGAAAPVARTPVMQSQQYRRSLRRTVERRDVTSLTRYLLSVSEACLAVEEPGPAAAPVLERVLGSLGFLAGRAEAPLAVS